MSKSHILQKNILTLDRLSQKGRALSTDGKWEVIGALPTEEVVVQFGGRRKGKQLGYLREVITPSSDRLSPRCQHVPDCGGCVLQQMSYPAQLEYKTQLVQEMFSTLIEQHYPEFRPIIGCDSPWEYRNKMEFSFSENREGKQFLGLMLAGGKGRVETIVKCHLVSDWFSEVLEAARLWWKHSGLKAYHHSTDEGHLRTLTLREAKQGRGKMVMLTVSGNPKFALNKEQIKNFVNTIQSTFNDPSLSIFLQIHQIAKGRPTQFFEMRLHGPDHITEVLHIDKDRMEFKISPTSFFQPNTLQAQRLFSEGIGMLSNIGEAHILDLYCGGATIGLSVAKKAKYVTGIEINPHSVFDAKWNREVNQVDNFSVHRGDVGEVLTAMRENTDFASPDAIIVDPPRVGLDPRAMQHIIDLSPKEILYISCNPRTQSENVTELSKAGYQLKILQPVDQFPHTIHIENIALLQKC